MHRLLSLTLLLLAILTRPSVAAPEPARSLGLQVTLVTELARFEIPPDPEPVPAAAHRRPTAAPRTSFVASASLVNRSRSGVTLTYADASSASLCLMFTLLDGDGHTVWASQTVPGAHPGPVERTIEPRGTLRRTIQVPLKTSSGAWLAAGHYTLRAEAGQGAVSATVPFEIPAAPVPAGSGIQGQVFLQFLGVVHPVVSTGTAQAAEGDLVLAGEQLDPLPGPVNTPLPATVTITEVRDPSARYAHPPFTWTGPTDATGHFKVATPAGRFSLSAYSPDVILAESVVAWINPIVTVVEGQFATQNLTVHGSLNSSFSLVYDVSSATVDTLSNDVLRIKAEGHATTTGWTNPRLVQRPSTSAKVLALDFVAGPPTGIAGQVILPIAAQTQIANTGGWTTVHVRASLGTVTASFVTTP